MKVPIGAPLAIILLAGCTMSPDRKACEQAIPYTYGIGLTILDDFMHASQYERYREEAEGEDAK